MRQRCSALAIIAHGPLAAAATNTPWRLGIRLLFPEESLQPLANKLKTLYQIDW
jgi:hypothetical protein